MARLRKKRKEKVTKVGFCIGHSGGPWDWKQGCLFSCSLLWTVVLCLIEFWLTNPFSFHPAKEMFQRVFCLFSLLGLELKKKKWFTAVLVYNMIYVFSSAFMLARPFCWLQCRSTFPPFFFFQSQLPWWPHVSIGSAHSAVLLFHQWCLKWEPLLSGLPFSFFLPEAVYFFFFSHTKLWDF